MSEDAQKQTLIIYFHDLTHLKLNSAGTDHNSCISETSSRRSEFNTVHCFLLLLLVGS